MPQPESLLAQIAARTVAMAGPDELHFPACAASHLGPWFIEPDYLRQALEELASGVWVLPRAATQALDENGDVAYHLTNDGIAQFSLVGPLEKGRSKFGTSTVRVRQALRQARQDPAVRGGMLLIDSPGGSVSGTEELASEVAAFAAVKPLDGHISGVGASGSLWPGVQVRRLSASPLSLVGSIGTVAVVRDTSGQLAKDGVKVHVISTGPYKGAFAPGSEVTDQQLEYLRGYVTDQNEHFLAAVAAGRKMPLEKVRAIADGRSHIAERARQMGLIDAVEGQDAAMVALRAACKQKESTMSVQHEASPGAVQPPLTAGESAPAPEASATTQATPPAPPTETARPPAPEAQVTPPTPSEAAVVVIDLVATTKADVQAECKKFITAFGPQGAAWWSEGKTFEQAQALHADAIKAERDRLVAENAELRSRTAAARGSPTPVSGTPAGGEPGFVSTQTLTEKVGPNIARVAAGLKFAKKSE